MRTIEQTIYNFDELEEETRKRLIEEATEEEKELYCNTQLNEDMQAEAEALLERYFLKATLKYIYYSLTYCQGDGAMIAFEVPIEAINEIAPEELRFTQKELEDFKTCDNTIKILHDNGCRYYHERSFIIDLEYNELITSDSGEWNEEREEKLNKLIKWLEGYIININKEFTATGYRFIEEKPEEAYIIEQLQENEYFKNGEIY